MIDELIAASRELYDRKLIHAAGGNSSIRDGDFVWISQTGAELGKLTADKLVKVDLDGTVLEGKAPSKEMNMHLAMYRARKDARAVVHVHPTYAIALSTLIGREFQRRRATLHDGVLRAGRTRPDDPVSPVRRAFSA